MSIATIRTTLSTALDAITGLRAAALVPDQVSANLAVVSRGAVEYDADFDGGATYRFVVGVYAPRTAERSSQLFLDTLCAPSGATSIKAALEAKTVATAAGVDYITVSEASEVQVATVGAVDFLTVDFSVEAVE